MRRIRVLTMALMAVVAARLAFEAVVDPLTLCLAAACAALLWRTRVNPTWLILGGGLVGLLRLAALNG